MEFQCENDVAINLVEHFILNRMPTIGPPCTPEPYIAFGGIPMGTHCQSTQGRCPPMPTHRSYDRMPDHPYPLAITHYPNYPYTL